MRARRCLHRAAMSSLIATPEDVDEKLQSGRFDLVILSPPPSQGHVTSRRNFRLARGRRDRSHWCGLVIFAGMAGPGAQIGISASWVSAICGQIWPLGYPVTKETICGNP